MAEGFPISTLIHCPSSVLDGAVMRLNTSKRNGRMDKRCNNCGCFQWNLLGFLFWLVDFFLFSFQFVFWFLGLVRSFFKIFNKTLPIHHKGHRKPLFRSLLGGGDWCHCPKAPIPPSDTPRAPSAIGAGDAYRVLHAGQASLASPGALWREQRAQG